MAETQIGTKSRFNAYCGVNDALPQGEYVRAQYAKSRSVKWKVERKIAEK
jgi:hypothetical protein